jgi:hypothetical protein
MKANGRSRCRSQNGQYQCGSGINQSTAAITVTNSSQAGAAPGTDGG